MFFYIFFIGKIFFIDWSPWRLFKCFILINSPAMVEKLNSGILLICNKSCNIIVSIHILSWLAVEEYCTLHLTCQYNKIEHSIITIMVTMVSPTKIEDYLIEESTFNQLKAKDRDYVNFTYEDFRRWNLHYINLLSIDDYKWTVGLCKRLIKLKHMDSMHTVTSTKRIYYTMNKELCIV